jgi:hypothetical protein
VNSRSAAAPITSAYIAAKAEISVAVAKPNLNPMKISASSPTVTTPPTHSFALAAASSSARVGKVLRPPKMMATAIRANAISPAGSSPATNSPPIDRLATKPRMIRLMPFRRSQCGCRAPSAIRRRPMSEPALAVALDGLLSFWPMCQLETAKVEAR